MRINKRLSELGVCSRREADRLIEAGRVLVNGKAAITGMDVTEADALYVDGMCVNPHAANAVSQNPEEAYRKASTGEKMLGRKKMPGSSKTDPDVPKPVILAYYKPRGIVTTTSDKDRAENIVEAVHYPTRVYPIGRLDKDSEGLILLTNQGELANQISRARNFHEKEYIVTVDHPVTRSFLDRMADGVYLRELDVKTRPCEVFQDMRIPVSVRIRQFHIILTEGKNRQIRRMCDVLGYRVKKLKRIRIMKVTLDGLKPGEYREILPEELGLEESTDGE